MRCSRVWTAPWDRSEILDNVASLLSGLAPLVVLGIAWFEILDRRIRERRDTERLGRSHRDVVEYLLAAADVVEPWLDAAGAEPEVRPPRSAFANSVRITRVAMDRIAPSTPTDAAFII